jgi:hypothetical protein
MCVVHADYIEQKQHVSNWYSKDLTGRMYFFSNLLFYFVVESHCSFLP